MSNTLFNTILLIVVFIPTIFVSLFTIVKYLYLLLVGTKFRAIGASFKLTFIFVKLGMFNCCEKEYSLIKNIGMFYLSLFFLYLFMEDECEFLKEQFRLKANSK